MEPDKADIPDETEIDVEHYEDEGEVVLYEPGNEGEGWIASDEEDVVSPEDNS